MDECRKRMFKRSFGRKATALVFAVVAAVAGSAADGGELRLMSYNLHHCAGMDRRVDCARTAAAVLKERPDFAGLQELDVNAHRSGRVDQPTELARLTGMHATFAKAIDLPTGGEYGVAVLSREKPLSVVREPLPGPEPRVLLLCEFTNCWFGTTHLDSGTVPGDPAPAHIMSVPIVSNAVARCAAAKPVFLTGDWNAVPQSPLAERMRGFLTTLNDTNRPTNGNLRRCIDYVTVDSANAGGFRIVERHVTLDKMTSDHKPVVVTLSTVPQG